MIDQSLVKSHFVGREYIWWVGQVAGEDSWRENIPGRPVDNNSGIRGFGERYRVAIMGYQPYDLNEVSDDELTWAYVKYPVTAGSGGRASFQSANIAQGDFVYGFFLDGEDAQIPIIDGILGRNQYQGILKNKPETVRFVEYSGFNPDDLVPYFSQKTQKGGGDTISPRETESNGGKQVVADSGGGKTINDTIDESVTGSNTQSEIASQIASEETDSPLTQPEDCEPIPLGRIQKEIQNVITEIQKIQKSIYTYNRAAANQISDIQEEINKQINKATKFVASGIKWVFIQIQKYVVNQVNERLRKTYYFLFPNERPLLKEAVENINDLIACLFRKFIGQLIGQIGSFLKEASKKVVNTTQCLVENLIGNTLGKIIKDVQDTLNQQLDSISSLIGQASSIVDDILGVITDVLSFLSCEEKPECSSVNQWNILSGTGKVSKSDFESIIGQSKNFAKSFETSLQNAQVGAEGLLTNDFSDVFNVDSCNIGPLLCGPPIAEFFGVGSGAVGNLVIGSAGEVIGIDMISFGFGYDISKSYARVRDNCGKGKGAVIRPVVEQVEIVSETDPQPTTTLPTSVDPTGSLPPGTITNGVTGIEVIEPGTGYLSSPDGSRGGNEYTWADNIDTIVKRSNGDYETPLPPGNITNVLPGDEVIIPPGTSVVTEPIASGEGGGETILGGNTVIITSPGVFTSPKPNFEDIEKAYPTLSTGSYPVITFLCDVNIIESGINYSPGDKLKIEPDIGAIAEPKFDSQGRLIDIKITESGEGFTEYPRLFIESETGYNAVLRPKLCIDRIGDDKLKEPEFQDKVISVIDCVGKV